ncbi:MAG: hypothetical protein NZ953_04370, partial [Thaumarchaeota archaeon]|nr:hypothetical protein [Candidatus Calditenuaceae archaeon]
DQQNTPRGAGPGGSLNPAGADTATMVLCYERTELGRTSATLAVIKTPEGVKLLDPAAIEEDMNISGVQVKVLEKMRRVGGALQLFESGVDAIVEKRTIAVQRDAVIALIEKQQSVYDRPRFRLAVGPGRIQIEREVREKVTERKRTLLELEVIYYIDEDSETRIKLAEFLFKTKTEMYATPRVEVNIYDSAVFVAGETTHLRDFLRRYGYYSSEARAWYLRKLNTEEKIDAFIADLMKVADVKVKDFRVRRA